jgi:hypothetical protein
MIGQTIVTIALLGAVTLAGDPVFGSSQINHPALAMRAAAGAPVSMSIGSLEFSERVDDDARPDDPTIEFDKNTDRVWVSFDFNDYHGEQLSFIVRANGSDWKFGDLDCCEGGSRGRFAFPIERRSGKALGGAAYEVRIYAGDAELAVGGFGVKGTKAFDDDDGD